MTTVRVQSVKLVLPQLPQLGQNCTNFQVLFRRNSLFVGPTSTQTPL